jgi:hypothetical protein
MTVEAVMIVVVVIVEADMIVIDAEVVIDMEAVIVMGVEEIETEAEETEIEIDPGQDQEAQIDEEDHQIHDDHLIDVDHEVDPTSDGITAQDQRVHQAGAKIAETNEADPDPERIPDLDPALDKPKKKFDFLTPNRNLFLFFKLLSKY